MRDRHPDLFDPLPADGEPAPAARLAPPATVLVFPLTARVGKVRDVARKLLATKTERHADHYRRQVTDALRVNLTSKHVPAEQHEPEIAAFWRAVALEVARQQLGRRCQ